MSGEDGRYCVIDFETTGLDAASCEVIEFAAVKVEYAPRYGRCGELGLNLASLCRPSQPIPYKITEITGIDNRMTDQHPAFEELLPMLLDFIGCDVVAAHNLPFDMGFLNAYCRRAGVDFNPPALCTLSLSRKLLPGLSGYRLGSVAGHLGIANTAEHRALGDAMTTAKVLIKLLELRDANAVLRRSSGD